MLCIKVVINNWFKNENRYFIIKIMGEIINEVVKEM